MEWDHTTPNPGSDAAYDQGCSCPVLDNCHGKFKPRPDGWIVCVSCMLHGSDKKVQNA